MPASSARTAGLLLIALAAGMAAPAPGRAQEGAAPSHAAAPVGRAVPLDGSIVLDGRLNEAAWEAAPPIRTFTQLDPREGAPVSEPTEVRVLFDDEALYIGARLSDSAPVSSRLARRDAFSLDSDWFTVALDSYHDHLTANRFSVNPSGVRRDDVLSGSGGQRFGGRGGRGGGGAEGDESWDPVWQAATAVTDSGWVAELRIPFSQLRFSRDQAQTWGIQLERRIARTQEHALFAFTPKTERGGVARYGHLEGLTGLQARNRLEVLPYLLARADDRAVSRSAAVDFPDPFRSGREFDGGVGADLKYRVTSNFTLDATVNPDFGQVEVDPAVINLTAFETRFQEKRPFFVEGAEIFRFGASGGFGGFGPPGGGPAQLLYSRRIGRAPHLRVPREAVYSDAPESTTILGAAKLTGRTRNGWSIGLLDAVTNREWAPFVDANGFQRQAVVEPLSNYLAGRVKRDFAAGRTTLGGVLTAVHRDLDEPALESRLRSAAYAGGVDFRHEWAERVWSVSGYLSPSYIGGSPEAILAAQRSSARYFQRPDAEHLELDPGATSLVGYTGQVDIGKRAGAWTGNVELMATSPGYEVNDLGFQTTADRLDLDTRFTYEQTRPGPLFRRWSASTGPDFTWNYAGDLLRGTARAFVNGQWLNYWTTSVSFGRELASFDDRLTRGGPLTRTPVGHSASFGLSTDPRKPYVAFGNAFTGWDEAGARRTSVNLNLALRPASTWEISVGPDLSWNRSVAQYVTTVADPLATHTFGHRYLFASLDQTTLGVETRLNVTFSPGLSLELYAQPFLSSGDYGTLKELRAPRTFDFLRYGTDTGTLSRTPQARYLVDPDGAGPARSFEVRDRDFNLRSLRGNAVLRWEWRPGSTLFLVWQQNRSERLAALAADPAYQRVGSFHLGRDARELFGLRPDNVLVIKLNYWLNP